MDNPRRLDTQASGAAEIPLGASVANESTQKEVDW
jgi:hypothetical protein